MYIVGMVKKNSL